MGYRVLLVEEDDNVRNVLGGRLRVAFRDLGMEVDQADSVSTVSTLVAQHDYDVMIVDAVVAGMPRLKLIEQVRTKQPRVPIILLSRPEQHYREDIERLKLFSLLPKPVDFGRLGEVIVSALALESKQRAKTLPCLGTRQRSPSKKGKQPRWLL